MRIIHPSIVIAIVISAALICSGCQRIIERQVIRQEMAGRQDNAEIVLSATLRDGSIVRFDRNGAAYISIESGADSEPGIRGVTERGEARTIGLSSIVEARVRTREFNGTGSALTVISIASVALTVLAAIAIASIRAH